MEDCIAQFLNFLRVEKNASDNTIQAYKNDLGQFAKQFAGNPEPPLSEWKAWRSTSSAAN